MRKFQQKGSKRISRRIAAGMLAFTMAFTMTACSVGYEESDDPNGGGQSKVDGEKMQLYIGNFNQGFGEEWLKNAAARFSELKKDKKYSDETTGVQIIIDDATIGEELIGSMATRRYEILFNESIDYYSWVQRGLVRDMTDIVEGDLGEYGEVGKSILSKMYPSAQENYKYTDGKYYAIPFYETTMGIIYDMDVFEANNLYMDKNGQFTLSSNTDPNASAGPDGDASTTVDNGLPATFSEFYAMCDAMKIRGVQPFTWTGKTPLYLTRFLQSMAAYLDGFEESRAYYDLSGNADNLVERFDGDQPVYMSDTQINGDNAYLMYQTAGKYYALSFLENILNNGYHNESKLNSNAYGHREAQDDFVTNNTTMASNSLKKDVAMLIDGTWFMNEALGTFEDLSKQDYFAGTAERKFGLMPLPHPDGWENAKYLYLDTNRAACMVSARTDDSKMELVKEFIQFLHTDEELIAFTETTSTLRAYEYLSGYNPEEGKATPYCKQLIALKQYIGDQVVYPMSSNEKASNNISKLYGNGPLCFSSKVGDTVYDTPLTALSGSSKVSAKDYFLGLGTFHSREWWNENIK